jgi:hypothetical protein
MVVRLGDQLNEARAMSGYYAGAEERAAAALGAAVDLANQLSDAQNCIDYIHEYGYVVQEFAIVPHVAYDMPSAADAAIYAQAGVHGRHFQALLTAA